MFLVFFVFYFVNCLICLSSCKPAKSCILSPLSAYHTPSRHRPLFFVCTLKSEAITEDEYQNLSQIKPQIFPVLSYNQSKPESVIWDTFINNCMLCLCFLMKYACNEFVKKIDLNMHWRRIHKWFHCMRNHQQFIHSWWRKRCASSSLTVSPSYVPNYNIFISFYLVSVSYSRLICSPYESDLMKRVPFAPFVKLKRKKNLILFHIYCTWVRV